MESISITTSTKVGEEVELLAKDFRQYNMDIRVSFYDGSVSGYSVITIMQIDNAKKIEADRLFFLGLYAGINEIKRKEKHYE